MGPVVLLLLLLCVLDRYLATDPCETEKFYHVPAYDDKRIRKDILWNVTKNHIYDCLHECLPDIFCLSAQYSGSSRICEGMYGKYDGVAVNTVVNPGGRLYESTKEEPCPECIAETCDQDGCGCDIGYATFGPVCRKLTECTTFDDTFTKFGNTGLWLHDFATHLLVNGDQCKQLCLADARCATADHDFILSTCFLKEITWWSHPADQRPGHLTVDHYQRGCAVWQE